MENRLEDLQKIYENVDENVRNLLSPLLQHAVDWEAKIEFFKNEIAGIQLCSKNVSKYRFFSRELKEAEQQYINLMRVLISALNKNQLEQSDDFEKFMEEVIGGKK